MGTVMEHSSSRSLRRWSMVLAALGLLQAGRWLPAFAAGESNVNAASKIGLTAMETPPGAWSAPGVDGNGQPAELMGPEVCQQCHWDRFESYENSPHGLALDRRTPAGRQACETCHGAGGNHVAGGGGRGVGGMRTFDLEKMSVEAINGVCLDCHSRGIVALWHGSMHQSRNLSCVNCHNVHGGHDKLLREPSQPQLCTTCHQQIRAQLLRPSHHPIREGKLVCTDCHNPHGTATERLISATTINDKCYECHAEKRGPFVFEHPPVRENCLNCHQPHGSSHEPLLKLKRPYLCQRCHNTLGHPSVLWARSEEDAAAGRSVYQLPPQLFMRSCTNCHVNIHGSNHPSGKQWHR